jgi:hypothetical protein
MPPEVLVLGAAVILILWGSRGGDVARRFGLGMFLGLTLGMFGLILPVLGLPGLVAIVVAAVGYGLWPSLSSLRLGFASGILVGLGGLFAYGAANTYLACAETTDFCGGADIVPIAALGALAMGAGAALGWWANALNRKQLRLP